MLNESGVTGANRVATRQDFKQFLTSYQKLISQFPGFVSMSPSGSYNSDLTKQDFGDIDLIVHIKSTQDKQTVKKELAQFFLAQPATVIVPFTSPKYAGKRMYNAGELISVRYHDAAIGYSAQIDNIIALAASEAQFKQKFLDFPAEIQGLVMGLVKIATRETPPKILFNKLGITNITPLEQDQEWEFTLSGMDLQLRKVTYAPGTCKEINREVVWKTRDFSDLQTLLYQYDISANFDDLLAQCRQNIKHAKSRVRVVGIFSSMITVKSGEKNSPKGAGKEEALRKIKQSLSESKSLFWSLLD